MFDHQRRILLYLATSLDGHIAREDGSVDWLPALGEEDYGYAQFLGSIDTVIMGRTTYEQVLTLGPYPYPGKKAYVFSRTRRGRDEHVEFVDEDVASFARRLRSTPGQDIWLEGGAQLAQAFLAAGEVDELIITVVPYLLGRGIPLFAGGPEQKLDLLESRVFSDGVVQHRYRL